MSLAGRLYRGETNLDFIGARKRWYAVSLVLVVICLGSMAIKGFNFGIEFSGGTQFVLSKPAGTSLSQVEEAVDRAGVAVQTAQEAGSGGSTKYVVRTEGLSVDETASVKESLADELGVRETAITDNAVSSSWGKQITQKALLGLGVFLVVVAIYLAIRFEPKMAIAALLALIHDLTLTAGVYSIVGFEVTPSTVVGLLTILGFSLYDTVVVFDKVAENTKGILGGARVTYGEAANLAVNETLMRSINTSLISLLPVGGLLFVGAGLLGVGTLKDLALVLFVGLAAGAYSSLFLATPWLVDLKEREPRYRALRDRVTAKRAGAGRAAAAKSAVVTPVATDDDADLGTVGADGEAVEDTREVATAAAGSRRPAAGARPAIGARPAVPAGQRRKPGGKGRPSGKRKR